MGFSRQEYWSRLPCTPPGYLPTQGLNPCLMSPALAGRFFTTNATWKVVLFTYSEAFKISPFFLQKFDHFTFLLPSSEKAMPSHSSTLAWKIPGPRSLVGCVSWSREESDKTEQLNFHFSLSCIGEGNGNPLQCSCLENPRDGGAWWAAVYGVTQSRTRLKWLTLPYLIWVLFTPHNLGIWGHTLLSRISRMSNKTYSPPHLKIFGFVKYQFKYFIYSSIVLCILFLA